MRYGGGTGLGSSEDTDPEAAITSPPPPAEKKRVWGGMTLTRAVWVSATTPSTIHSACRTPETAVSEAVSPVAYGLVLSEVGLMVTPVPPEVKLYLAVAGYPTGTVVTDVPTATGMTLPWGTVYEPLEKVMLQVGQVETSTSSSLAAGPQVPQAF